MDRGEYSLHQGQQVYQLKKVLRIKAGEDILVLNNSGFQYKVRLTSIDEKEARGEVVSRSPCPTEPQIKINLYQALLKGDKFDFVLQKCTEVGVACFIPVACERCIARNPGSVRISRWQRIIIEAAEQSKRGRLPPLHPLIPFQKACELATGFSLIPWEGEEGMGLKTALRGQKVTLINIFIGPEGGFTPQEVEFARSKGIVPVTLGRRILRAETAGLVTASAILYEYGELG